VAHIRDAATLVLGSAMRQGGALGRAELAASVLEETASAIEEGDHWKEFT